MKTMSDQFDTVYRCRDCFEIAELGMLHRHECKVESGKKMLKNQESAYKSIDISNSDNGKQIHYYESAKAIVKDYVSENKLPIGSVVIFKLYSREMMSEVYSLEVVGSKAIGRFFNKADAEKCGKLYM
jgi:hypothetical protein